VSLLGSYRGSLTLKHGLAGSRTVDGMEISVKDPRTLGSQTALPTTKGVGFIPHFRPIDILACIHLLSYRLIWDTRMASGRIIQRYGNYNFLFYTVYRGIGQIHRPRDTAGVQDVRCWGPHGVPQRMALPNTEKVDIIYKSVDAPEIPLQEGKVRMNIILGAWRIEWKEALQGCNVTFLNDTDACTPLPNYIWNILSMELPKIVNRLRGSMEQFGVPPYVLDVQDCVVIQNTVYYSEHRKITFRHHVRKPGTYPIILDRVRMYPFGELRKFETKICQKGDVMLMILPYPQVSPHPV
jgi:hypothetical protein